MSSSISRKSNRSVLIQSADGGDASYGIIVPVKPFSQYLMAGWMKTENLVTTKGKGALLNVHGIEGAETPALAGIKSFCNN